jgi:hypothetical protein
VVLFCIAGAFSVLLVDLYELFFTGDGPCRFYQELWTGELSVVVTVFFLGYGLMKKEGFRRIRWIFLALIILDGVFSYAWAVQSDGKNVDQLLSSWRHQSLFLLYRNFVWPMLLDLGIRMLTAISFQMQKPYFLSFSSPSPSQKAVFRIIAVGFYIETVIGLFLATSVVLARH